MKPANKIGGIGCSFSPFSNSFGRDAFAKEATTAFAFDFATF